jgi:hypothetical protein
LVAEGHRLVRERIAAGAAPGAQRRAKTYGQVSSLYTPMTSSQAAVII